MRQPTAISPTTISPSATGPSSAPDRGDRPERPAARPSWTWTLIEALANAGAAMNPTGAVAVLRMREALEEARRAQR
jgi:hypothetical protein